MSVDEANEIPPKWIPKYNLHAFAYRDSVEGAPHKRRGKSSITCRITYHILARERGVG